MRRSYGVNPNEWELMFYAPLTTDATDVVGGMPYSVSTKVSARFDSTRGFYCSNYSTSNYDDYSIYWDMRSTPFMQKLYDYDVIVMSIISNREYIRSNVMFRVASPDRGLSQWDGFVTNNPQETPANVDITFFVEQDFKNGVMTNYNDYNSIVRTKYNDFVWGGTPVGPRIGLNWGSTNGYRGWFRELKIYGKKL